MKTDITIILGCIIIGSVMIGSLLAPSVLESYKTIHAHMQNAESSIDKSQ